MQTYSWFFFKHTLLCSLQRDLIYTRSRIAQKVEKAEVKRLNNFPKSLELTSGSKHAYSESVPS